MLRPPALAAQEPHLPANRSRHKLFNSHAACPRTPTTTDGAKGPKVEEALNKSNMSKQIFEQMLTSRDSSITPPNLALTKHKEDQYNDYINTGSSGTFKSFKTSVHVLYCTICRNLQYSKYIHIFHSFSDVREFNRCK